MDYDVIPGCPPKTVTDQGYFLFIMNKIASDPPTDRYRGFCSQKYFFLGCRLADTGGEREEEKK